MDEFRDSRQRSDARILDHVRDQLAGLIDSQRQALQDVHTYLPRAESRHEARAVVDALRNVDADVRAYLAELKLCDQDARISTREHLVRCADRRGMAKRLDALEERALYTFDALEDALEPLQSTWRTVKDWTASALTWGAGLLKRLGLFLLNHWKVVAGSVFVAMLTFPTMTELLGTMIGKLDGIDSPWNAIQAMMKAVFYTFCSQIAQGMVLGFIYLLAYFIVGNADALIDMGASMSNSMVGWVSGAGKFVKTLCTRLKSSILEYGNSVVLAITIAAVIILGPALKVIDALTSLLCYTHDKLDDAVTGLFTFGTNAATGFMPANAATYIPKLQGTADVHALRILLAQLQGVMGGFVNFGQQFNLPTTLDTLTFVDDTTFNKSYNSFANGTLGTTLSRVSLPQTGLVTIALKVKKMHEGAGSLVGGFIKSAGATAAIGYLVFSVMSLAYVTTSGAENDDLVEEVSRMAAQEARTVQFVDVERDTPLTGAEAAVYFPMDQNADTMADGSAAAAAPTDPSRTRSVPSSRSVPNTRSVPGSRRGAAHVSPRRASWMTGGKNKSRRRKRKETRCTKERAASLRTTPKRRNTQLSRRPSLFEHATRRAGVHVERGRHHVGQ